MTIAPPGAAPAELAHHQAITGRPTLVVPALDGFRGLAAMAVLLYHCMMGAARPPLDEGPIRSILVSGYMGVDFFFVISGFVLFLPTVVNGGQFGSVRAYALRRAARIIPACWVVLLVLSVTQPLLTSLPADLPFRSIRGTLSLLLHMTFLEHSIGVWLGLPVGFMVHGGLWTLTLEALFYVLLPLVAARYYRRPFVGLLIAVAVSMAWKLAITWPPTVDPKEWSVLRIVLVTQLPTYLAHFGAGMTAAVVFVRLRNVVIRPAHRAVAGGVAAGAALAVLLGMRAEGTRDLVSVNGLYDHFTRPVYVALAFAVLVASTALAPRWVQLPFTNPLSRRLGDMSYGIYLWHLMFTGFAMYTLDFPPDASNWAFFRMLLFVLPLSLVAAWLSMRFVEQPAIRWARKRTSAILRRDVPAVRRAPAVAGTP
ncbi:MAG: acyltransferase [Actinomycetota bacterium]|nr:acyltransferase [Actinomycetota bacterium]